VLDGIFEFFLQVVVEGGIEFIYECLFGSERKSK